jgi:3-hydroxyisobutyrate dehydrogenase
VKQLEAKGAVLVDSPAAVAASSDLVLHMVGHPADVEEVLLGPNGTLSGLRPGGYAVDMTTSSPALAVRIAEAAEAAGVVSIDAPVTGGDVGAKNGTLSILLGGDETACTNLKPFLLDTVASTTNYFGGPGQGQQAKLANQIGISTQIVAMAESMLFAHKAGLDLATWLPAVANGGMGSFSVSNYAPRVMDRNFDPGFYVTHFIKDLGLALDECQRMGLKLPGLELAHQLFVRLAEQGHGDKGIHGLVLALEAMNGGEALPQQKVTLP